MALARSSLLAVGVKRTAAAPWTPKVPVLVAKRLSHRTSTSGQSLLSKITAGIHFEAVPEALEVTLLQ